MPLRLVFGVFSAKNGFKRQKKCISDRGLVAQATAQATAQPTPFLHKKTRPGTHARTLKKHPKKHLKNGLFKPHLSHIYGSTVETPATHSKTPHKRPQNVAARHTEQPRHTQENGLYGHKKSQPQPAM